MFHTWSVVFWAYLQLLKQVALYDFFDGPLAHLNGKFMEKVNCYNRTKQIDYSMESVTFVLAIIDSVSKNKWGSFFPCKLGYIGGGGFPGSYVLKTQRKHKLFFEYFPYALSMLFLC